MMKARAAGPPGLDLVLALIVSVVLVVPVAALTYRWIEKPAMDFAKSGFYDARHHDPGMAPHHAGGAAHRDAAHFGELIFTLQRANRLRSAAPSDAPSTGAASCAFAPDVTR